MAESSARLAGKDPALADLVRNEQDLGKQIGAELGMLNNVARRCRPASATSRASRALNAAIAKLRGAAREGPRS